MWYIWVICSLCAVIPASAVFVVLWARLISAESRINAALGTRDDISRMENRLKLVEDTAAKNKTDLANLDESFTTLNNKWAARMRTQEYRERKRVEREEVEPVEQDQQPPVLPLQPPQPQQPKRMVFRRKVMGL